MNKKEYMKILEKELHHIPKADREKALDYYNEYFAEAGTENEENVVEELGSPSEVGRQIIRDLAVKKIEDPKKSVKKGFSATWIVILAIFSLPVSIPLAVAGLFLCLAVIIAFSAFFLIGGVVALTGILCIPIGIYFLFSVPATGLSVIGMGFLMGGISVFILYGTAVLWKGFFKNMGNLFKHILNRKQKKRGR